MVIKYNGDVIPCCWYRLGSQYTETDDPMVLGNVFETSVREVWNSQRYREARRLVGSPEAVKSESNLAETFCYACARLFNIDRKPIRGDKHRFEEFYTLGADGRPVRRPETIPGVVAAPAA
jgi:hypothetical protein